MTAKIESWMENGAREITLALNGEGHIKGLSAWTGAKIEQNIAAIIAAHAPKQDSFESTEWFREEIERLERLLREQAPKETGIKPDNAQAAIKQEPSVPISKLKELRHNIDSYAFSQLEKLIDKAEKD